MLSRTTKGISHRLYQIRSIHKITLPQTKNEQRAKRQVGLRFYLFFFSNKRFDVFVVVRSFRVLYLHSSITVKSSDPTT